jgi:Na+/H+ antiporter NhaD/arsenite permease-like protein
VTLTFALGMLHSDLLGASAIFVATYLVLAIGRFPGTTIDRSAMAIIGATLMVGCRIVSPAQAIASIDFATIVLLFSMMLIVASLHQAGFFDWITELVVAHVRPEHLLPTVVFSSGLLSSVLINDIVCLVMAPLVVRLCRQFSKQPVPYLLALSPNGRLRSSRHWGAPSCWSGARSTLDRFTARSIGHCSSCSPASSW